MDIERTISALNLKSRRHILKVLSKYFGYPSDSLTVKELMSELSQNSTFSVKHRESIFKALKTLVESGLVEKRYEKKRGMCYRIVKTKLEIDLARESIE